MAAAVECTYRCERHAVEFALMGSIYSGIVYSSLSGFLHAVFECVKVVLVIAEVWLKWSDWLAPDQSKQSFGQGAFNNLCMPAMQSGRL